MPGVFQRYELPYGKHPTMSNLSPLKCRCLDCYMARKVSVRMTIAVDDMVCFHWVTPGFKLTVGLFKR